MRKTGIAILVIGILGMFAMLGMDTTVEGLGGSRVSMSNLENLQKSSLFVFFTVTIAGILILMFGGHKSQSLKSTTKHGVANTKNSIRPCPFCAEDIKSQAIVCRYCGHDVVPHIATPAETVSTSEFTNDATPTEILSSHLLNLEAFFRNTYISVGNLGATKSLTSRSRRLSEFFTRHTSVLAIILILFGASLLIRYAIHFDFSIKSAYITLAGLIIYFRKLIIKKVGYDKSTSMASTESKGSPSYSLPFFGHNIDLFVFQASIIILVFVLHNSHHPNLAYALAILVAATGYFISRSGGMTYGASTFLIGVAYIGYRHWFLNESAYFYEIFRMNYYGYGYSPVHIVFDMGFYFLIIVLSAAIPHLQLIRLGQLKYGQIQGDITPVILGHKVFLPLGSVLVFYILLLGISNALLQAKWGIQLLW